MGMRLTREERKWMMLWTVMGRPEHLPFAMFVSLPHAAAEALEDEPEFFEAYDTMRNRYTLHSPHPYLYEATRWRLQKEQRYLADTARGNFEAVMAAIRRWVAQ